MGQPLDGDERAGLLDRLDDGLGVQRRMARGHNLGPVPSVAQFVGAL